MPSRYPTRDEIWALCSYLGTSEQSKFFDRVAPDVTWDVMGTHPAAGHFTSLEAWKEGALGIIQKVLAEPLTMKVINVVGGGEQDWALAELEANAQCKNGMSYPQKYAWVLRFNEKGIIVQARAYLDSALVEKAVASNSRDNIDPF